ncbi:MAG: hypothetical protein GF333_00740 [Candidatus Omnitrophica bacterium]|nr:hypothetical protein [Candidatus Omnitrophota bacterium]
MSWFRRMKSTARRRWQVIRAGSPGARFQSYYRIYHRKERLIVHLAVAVGAGVCFVIALILAVTPGPAVLFWILGISLLLSRMPRLARRLDMLELKLRTFCARSPFFCRIFRRKVNKK